ncbi:transglycosylase SLT domain-containing protein [Teredinibacter purpureus]|uniref:hypothetical protein n=1 Tax=Teredinibacter purpureus TaxID=2731756 RepID=UPI000698DE83|nr:hypothetical protein [Teredinibacter purpureus]
MRHVLPLNAKALQPGIVCLVTLFLVLLPSPAFSDKEVNASVPADVLEFSYPASSDSFYQQRNDYFVQMLTLALERSGRAYSIKPVAVATMNEKRSKIFIKSGRYNTHWMLTNNESENELLPVRIPLYKGLIGWRLLAIHKSQQDRFAKINKVEELKALTATQGLGWPDVSILQAHGFTLRLGVEWNSLLELMSTQRVDYMPLAVNDIWSTTERLHKKNLVVENHLVLHYPSAYYFFLDKTLTEHAAALSAGLNNAIADGSFDRLFQKKFGDVITHSKLNQRRVLKLNNPLIPIRTPLRVPSLWFSPQAPAKDNLGYGASAI